MSRTSAVVAILDRDAWSANTDVIVVVDTAEHTLTWVPRDLWSPLLGDRINAAFAAGGCAPLLAALAELGFACEHALCLRRAAVEAVLAAIAVTVPVGRPLAFWYPLAPTLPIEDGRKQVAFAPPAETLSGERLHQWIGARLAVDGVGTDFGRMLRQQVLLRTLLADGHDLSIAVADPDLVRASGTPLPLLAHVTQRWAMRTFDAVQYTRIGGKSVVVSRAMAAGLGIPPNPARWPAQEPC